jgi:MerR family transcriptional regulator, copper efflux regulator
MRIGELAKETGVSVRVLRHYEAQGLIFSRRQVNGYRDYGASAVETVGHVRVLLGCGFSTKQIQSFVPCFGQENFDPEACVAGLEQHVEKLKEIDDLMIVLQERRQRLLKRMTLFRTSSPEIVSKRKTTHEFAEG